MGASTRDGRIGHAVVDWFVDQAGQREDLTVDKIDLADTRLPESLTRGAEEALALQPRLAAADGFVVVTPEYNHSYPASVKILIDSFRVEWQAKPVGFVSYGGISGGLRAVEHLRQVFAEVHGADIRETVSFHQVWEQFDADGGFPKVADACNAAAKTMLDQWVWWATTLKEGRAARPYGA